MKVNNVTMYVEMQGKLKDVGTILHLDTKDVESLEPSNDFPDFWIVHKKSGKSFITDNSSYSRLAEHINLLME